MMKKNITLKKLYENLDLLREMVANITLSFPIGTEALENSSLSEDKEVITEWVKNMAEKPDMWNAFEVELKTLVGTNDGKCNKRIPESVFQKSEMLIDYIKNLRFENIANELMLFNISRGEYTCSEISILETLKNTNERKNIIVNMLKEYSNIEERTAYRDLLIINNIVSELSKRGVYRGYTQNIKDMQSKVEAIDKEKYIVDYGNNYENYPFQLAQKVAENLSVLEGRLDNKEKIFKNLMDETYRKEILVSLVSEYSKLEENKHRTISYDKERRDIELIKSTLDGLALLERPIMINKDLLSEKKQINNKSQSMLKSKAIKKNVSHNKQQAQYLGKYYDIGVGKNGANIPVKIFGSSINELIGKAQKNNDMKVKKGYVKNREIDIFLYNKRGDNYSEYVGKYDIQTGKKVEKERQYYRQYENKNKIKEKER